MKLNEFELRRKLINYMGAYAPVLSNLLESWNNKLSAGIPLENDYLYDLFGGQIESIIKDKLILTSSHSDNLISLSVGSIVNEENPFQVYFVYKVETHETGELHVFMIGDEQLLIEHCLERGFE